MRLPKVLVGEHKMPYKLIAKQIPTFQAIGLLAKHARIEKKKRLKDLLGGFTGTIVGLPLMKKTADILAGL